MSFLFLTLFPVYYRKSFYIAFWNLGQNSIARKIVCCSMHNRSLSREKCILHDQWLSSLENLPNHGLRNEAQ